MTHAHQIRARWRLDLTHDLEPLADPAHDLRAYAAPRSQASDDYITADRYAR